MTGDVLHRLLLDVRAGDQNAFVRLYEQYLPLIERLSEHFSRGFSCGADAEDFRQEAALALYQAALAFRLDQDAVQFGLFAKVCMTNRLIDRLRALDRCARTEAYTEEESGEGALADHDPAAKLLDAEAVASITAVMDAHLSAYEQRILKLYLSGYSAREIARAAAREEKSVTNAIYRIRRKLKTLLQS
ncbi:MAG: sigma-70 family RNA polymerase sigma factor [Clostridia bacterium]|nr:sigma-70 family RNA polymerase sigma factor [Clostridia bacterium]